MKIFFLVIVQIILWMIFGVIGFAFSLFWVLSDPDPKQTSRSLWAVGEKAPIITPIILGVVVKVGSLFIVTKTLNEYLVSITDFQVIKTSIGRAVSGGEATELERSIFMLDILGSLVLMLYVIYWLTRLPAVRNGIDEHLQLKSSVPKFNTEKTAYLFIASGILCLGVYYAIDLEVPFLKARMPLLKYGLPALPFIIFLFFGYGFSIFRFINKSKPQGGLQPTRHAVPISQNLTKALFFGAIQMVSMTGLSDLTSCFHRNHYRH